jgi:hypothetical protein
MSPTADHYFTSLRRTLVLNIFIELLCAAIIIYANRRKMIGIKFV